MPIQSARNVLNRFWNRSIPVNPFEIAQSAGAQVYPDHSMTSQGLSGSFMFENNLPIIRYNPDDAYVRRRFTVAHEIGHWVLNHGPSMRDTAHNYRMDTVYYQERDANSFAAELLMPQQVVEWMVYQNQMTDVRKMADLLEVSGAAMHYRLLNLGLLRDPHTNYQNW